MKHFLTGIYVVLSMLFALSAETAAQNYCVYRVNGDVYSFTKKKKAPVKEGMVLTAKDVLHISHHGMVKLFNEKEHEMVTLTGRSSGSIASLIDSQMESRESMSTSYFKFVLHKMTSGSGSDNMMEVRTTAIIRDADILSDHERDSLLSVSGLVDLHLVRLDRCNIPSLLVVERPIVSPVVPIRVK